MVYSPEWNKQIEQSAIDLAESLGIPLNELKKSWDNTLLDEQNQERKVEQRLQILKEKFGSENE